MALTNLFVNGQDEGMHEVSTIEDPAAAEASLDPLRRQILGDLIEPGSASTIAARLGIPRQKVNYHLRVLEQHGLVELVEERRRGNFTERILQATSASYVISPGALGRLQPDPGRAPDQLSARWLLALASRLVRDVGTLLAGAQRARKPVATFAIDGQIRFASAADRAAFTKELAAVVTELVARHHTGQEPGTAGTGKLNRLVIALHPAVPDTANGDLH
jgi:DNA-binding transcriptional ArsR family regulator